MYDVLTLEASNAATLRLVDGSWASYLQRMLHCLKISGQTHKTDGMEALLERFKRTRLTTYYHSVRVCRLSRAVGRAVGFDHARLKALSYAALLHDAGKILVPEVVLNRPRKPTRTELFILHLHPSFGALLASYYNLPAELRIRTQHHHERWDGKGYPHRLGGEDIPLMARIVQIGDTYDAMVSDRPYRKPLTHEQAVTELRAHARKQFDPLLVEAFLDACPTGASVEKLDRLPVY
jgi:HD-GYP domain-containing protein (c-di-GMP phosphodiesterase class II)